jgi:hypothetical protein
VTSDSKAKSFGQAIDEIIAALQGLEPASRAVAIRAACAQVGVEVPAASGQSGAAASGEQPRHDTAGEVAQSSAEGSRVPDIRTLRADKQPTSAVEMAALVAHYLESLAPDSERKNTVTTADLDKYFRQADFPLQKRLEQVLPNAKAAGYFDSAARAAYRLNPVGYNLVVHTLPRGTSTGSTRKPRVPAGRKAAPRKSRRKP